MRTLTMVSFSMSKALLERLEDIARYLNVPVDSLVEFAVEREVRRKEIERVKDEISEEEIRLNILPRGESIAPQLDGEAALDLNAHNCELCGTFFFHHLREVEGPIFCDGCLKLAKGGEFELIDKQLAEAGLVVPIAGESLDADERH
ncbi:MAG: hypothetical protein HY342_04105 [Candidatus Lambdaproteobacteria bacterium]|nr:hypothetical protein [Candidatus Lambdaproteobacteria bacterium]